MQLHLWKVNYFAYRTPTGDVCNNRKDNLIERLKLSGVSNLKKKLEIAKLKAEVAELEEKNQALLQEKHQLIEVRLDTDSTNRLSHQC